MSNHRAQLLSYVFKMPFAVIFINETLRIGTIIIGEAPAANKQVQIAIIIIIFNSGNRYIGIISSKGSCIFFKITPTVILIKPVAQIGIAWRQIIASCTDKQIFIAVFVTIKK